MNREDFRSYHCGICGVMLASVQPNWPELEPYNDDKSAYVLPHEYAHTDHGGPVLTCCDTCCPP